jgi:tetratricopeptide (TPR) repeat protein
MNEVLPVCHAKSSIYRPVLLVIETSVLYQARNTDRNDFWAERSILPILPLSVNELQGRAELYLQSDDLNALDEVISLHYDALKYYSTAHHHHHILLSNLGAMLLTRFGRRGDVKDLDEAIARSTEALTLRPVGHLDRPSSLNNIASVLSTRFEHRGDDRDIDEAIALYREDKTLHPIGHPDRPSSLNNFAKALSTRFKHRGREVMTKTSTRRSHFTGKHRLCVQLVTQIVLRH